VVRVNFTADDLARTRFSADPAPLVETAMALVELRRAGGRAPPGPRPSVAARGAAGIPVHRAPAA
jgi:hypothetical protein